MIALTMVLPLNARFRRRGRAGTDGHGEDDRRRGIQDRGAERVVKLGAAEQPGVVVQPDAGAAVGLDQQVLVKLSWTPCTTGMIMKMIR